MNVPKIIDLTAKLQEAYEALKAEIMDQGEADNVNRISGNEQRRQNSTSKARLVKLFKKNPSGFFTLANITKKVTGVSRTVINKQLTYLATAGFIEKVGDTYRKTESGEAQNTDKAENPNREDLERRVLESISKKPTTMEKLRKEVKGNYYNMRTIVQSLLENGSLKEVVVKAKTSNGRKIQSKRIASIDYKESA
jgi:biotin operon repressor